MKMFRNQNYYEILEIRPDASYKEIEEAYRRAKETYSGESPATYSLLRRRSVMRYWRQLRRHTGH